MRSTDIYGEEAIVPPTVRIVLFKILIALFTPRESNHGSITDKSTLTYDYEQIDITPEVRSFTKKNYWYPLPQHDVDALNNLQQNPYW